jgi:hypothetical protein
VLGPLDRDVLSEDRPEHPELGATEACARFCRLADRAVVLDQKQIVRLTCDLGHVTLGGAHSSERPGAFSERVARFTDRLLVLVLLRLGPKRDHLVQHVFSGDRPDGFYYLRGQLAVTVGEEPVRAPGEPPPARRAPRRTCPLVGHRDEIFCSQTVEVLAHRSRGEA